MGPFLVMVLIHLVAFWSAFDTILRHSADRVVDPEIHAAFFDEDGAGPFQGMITCFTMFIGDFQTELFRSNYMAWILFILFLILMPVVMLNALIAVSYIVARKHTSRFQRNSSSGPRCCADHAIFIRRVLCRQGCRECFG